jgi:hypothetical protein
MRRSILTSVFLGTLTAFSCSLVAPSFAAGADPNAALAPAIASMENKFFDHAFPEETMEVRVGRLEKTVFGAAKTGPLQERIIALTASVLNPSIDAPEKPSASTASETPVLKPLPLPVQQPIPVEQPKVIAAPEPPMDYPRVTALEQQMLGKTYVNEPVQQRLVRLENKLSAPSPVRTT